MNPITIFKADEILRERLLTTREESVFLSDANGRILAEDLRADRDFPPYQRSCMDGYAVPGEGGAIPSGSAFKVVREQPAGVADGGPVHPGEAVKINTGGIVPTHCDRVIPHEYTRPGPVGQVLIDQDSGPAGFIHKRGSDARAGQVLVNAGTRITPAVVAVAATIGRATLSIKQNPRIGILTTGKEIVPVEATPEPHQIRSSNGPYLQSLFRQNGFAVEMAHASDDPVHLRETLVRLMESCLVILTTGGVSVGEYDFLPRVFTALGAQCWFHGIRQKPGKPLWCGAIPNGAVFFGLPGNPASSSLCAVRHVIPWLLRSLGLREHPFRVPLGDALTNDLVLTRFVPVRLESGYAFPLPLNTSGDFLTLLEADGWVEISSGQALGVGAKIAYTPL